MNSPRFSGATNKDNTDRIVKRDYQSPAYATPLAISIKGPACRTLIQPAQLTGALSITIGVGSSTTPPLVGDEVEFLFGADGTNRVVTFSTGFITPGTVTVTASKFAYVSFMFNGTAWQEMSRSITA
jgi:hypothetical protein